MHIARSISIFAKVPRRWFLLMTLALAIAWAWSPWLGSAWSSRRASGATFPSKPVRVIVYTGPGGMIDITARRFIEVARKHVDATFVVENHPGGGGIVAMERLLQLPPDGHAMLAGTRSNIAKLVALGKSDYFDRIRWIAILLGDPECVITRVGSATETWEDVLRHARSGQGRQIWLGPAAGGLDHLVAAKIWNRFDIPAVWIPYQSGGKARAALLGGQGIAYVGNPAEARNNPQLRVAVVSHLGRLDALPDVPTFAEFGAPELDRETMWRGFAVRSEMPEQARQWYDHLFQAVAADRQWRSFWENDGMDVRYRNQRQVAALIDQDRRQFQLILRDLGMLENEASTRAAGRKVPGHVTLLLSAVSLGLCLLIAGRRKLVTERPLALLIPTLLLALGFSAWVASHLLDGQLAGPATVPRLWAMGMVALAIVQLVVTAAGRQPPQRLSAAETRSVLVVLSLLGMYTVGIYLLGYFPATMVFLPLTMRHLGLRRVPTVVAVTLLWLLIAYGLFDVLLRVPLPLGRLVEPWVL